MERIVFLAVIGCLFSSSVEFVSDVKPENYRLFQAADLLCSVELVAARMNANCMSVSGCRFFGEEREFKRNILRQIKAKEI